MISIRRVHWLNQLKTIALKLLLQICSCYVEAIICFAEESFVIEEKTIRVTSTHKRIFFWCWG
jgi:hypothetical protein